MAHWLKNLFSPSKQAALRDHPKRPPTQLAAVEKSISYKEQGDAHLREGDLEEAKTCYRQAITLNSAYAKAYNNLGLVLKEQGLYEEAEQCLKTALAIDPEIAHAHYLLGTISQFQGKLEDAIDHFQKALAIAPDFETVYCELCHALFQQGKIADAKQVIAKGITLNPSFHDFYYYQGNLHKHTGELDKAATDYQAALSIQPDYMEVHYNLGMVLQEQGKLSEAIVSFQKVISLKPDHAEAYLDLGNTLKGMDRLDEAEASYLRALQIKPDIAEAHNNLGAFLIRRGEIDKAIASWRFAVQIKPDYAEAHNNLGIALTDIGELDEAEASCRLALQIKPDYALAYNNLGNTLKALQKSIGALESYRQALQLKPDFIEAHNNLGITLVDLGRLDEAEVSYRRAIEINPDYDNAHSNLLYCLTQNATMAAEMLFFEHCRFGEQFEPPLRASRPPHTNSRTPERTLQIGFVSGDIRNHAVANFIEPVLAHLSGYPQLSLHAYANHAIQDATTLRLQKYFAHWHAIVGLSDEALAEKIRTDRIDILIDLSGHTARNRLLTFARKPAPVQASWIGYPGTTGLQAMDYYLADRFFLPDETFRAQFTEKIVYLPANTPFIPFKEAPSVNVLPALSKGFVTFGSFNRMGKLSPSVIATWSQLLRAVPKSRIVLGATPEDGYDTLVDWFAQEGIVRKRLSFYPRCGMGGYLALHHQVDICLDTFPYNGGTTTCHALWMGVPTLTMAGSTPSSRVGAILLNHVGLEGFIAQNKNDFVKKGQAWAHDITALAELRAELRLRFEQSAMGQPALIAEGLERALRIMWQRWCNGLSPTHLDVNDDQMDCVLRESGQ